MTSDKQLCSSDWEYIEYVRSFSEAYDCVESLEQLLGIEFGVRYFPTEYFPSDKRGPTKNGGQVIFSKYRVTNKAVWPASFPLVTSLSVVDPKGVFFPTVTLVYPSDFTAQQDTCKSESSSSEGKTDESPDPHEELDAT